MRNEKDVKLGECLLDLILIIWVRFISVGETVPQV